MLLDITNKNRMYFLWKRGAFGNKVAHWDTLGEFISSTYEGRCGFRSTKIGSRNMGVFDSKEELLKNHPVTNEVLVYSEGTLSDTVIIQGEITRGISGLYLYYSTVKDMMRPALATRTSYALRTEAHSILQTYCDPASYEDLMLLLDMYPDHVIEFSTFSHNLGIVPHRNTVIWEVRKY